MRRESHSLLWRVEHPEAPGPSWVFGTMHVQDRRAFAWVGPVQDRIRRCQVFATEFKLDDLAGAPDPQALLLPPGLTLPGLLGQRSFDKLRRVLIRSVDLDIRPLQRLLPLLILNLVDERMLARDMAASLDETLYRFAQREGKDLRGIETYEEQLQLLRRIPLSIQVAALRSLGRNIRGHRRHLKRMCERYAAGDLPALYRSARRGAHHLRRSMLYHRNAIMAARTAQLLRTNTAVCAVGAAHLWGGRGLLRLLKHRGFTVRANS